MFSAADVGLREPSPFAAIVHFYTVDHNPSSALVGQNNRAWKHFT